jgi:hypothetical protein
MVGMPFPSPNAVASSMEFSGAHHPGAAALDWTDDDM